MSLDASKVTLYGLVGLTNAKLVATKVTMYALVLPAGSIPGPPRRRRVSVSSRITYSEG